MVKKENNLYKKILLILLWILSLGIYNNIYYQKIVKPILVYKVHIYCLEVYKCGQGSRVITIINYILFAGIYSILFSAVNLFLWVLEENRVVFLKIYYLYITVVKNIFEYSIATEGAHKKEEIGIERLYKICRIFGKRYYDSVLLGTLKLKINSSAK